MVLIIIQASIRHNFLYGFLHDKVFIRQSLSKILQHPAKKFQPVRPQDLPQTLRPRERTIKEKLYARSGVRELWLVNTAAQAIEVFDLEKAEEEQPALFTRTGRERLESKVLPGLQADLDQIF